MPLTTSGQETAGSADIMAVTHYYYKVVELRFQGKKTTRKPRAMLLDAVMQ